MQTCEPAGSRFKSRSSSALRIIDSLIVSRTQSGYIFSILIAVDFLFLSPEHFPSNMLKRWLDFLFGVPLVLLLSLFARRRKVDSNPRKILLIKLAAMGDTIVLIPVIHSLREAYPKAVLHWLVSSVNAAVAGSIPYVDKTILWEGTSPPSLLNLIFRLRREQYDVVVDFEQWARGTALLSYFSGAPRRIGFNTPGQFRDRLFTDSLEKKYQAHEIDDFYELASKLGPLRKQQALEIFETEKGKKEIASVLDVSSDEFRVLIHPGCGADGFPREWPLSKYAEIAEWLMKEYGARIIISGGPEEREKTSKLNSLLKMTAIDVGGRLSWDGMISLAKRVNLVLSGNTGVMHIAAALQKKQIALHGPTNSNIWGPVNPNAVVINSPCPGCPCLKLGFEYHRRDGFCMDIIEVEEVKRAVRSLLG